MNETTEETTTETTEPAVEPVPDTEPDTDLEPDAPLEPDAEPIQGDDADEGTEDTEPATAPDAPQAMSEKEIEKRNGQRRKENMRHAARISEIMGSDAPDLIPCPLCMNETIAIMSGMPPDQVYGGEFSQPDGAGWVYAPEVQQLPPDSITRIRQLIGLPDLTTYREATFTMQCPECGGLGEVKTGSLVNGSEVTTCEKCGKKGYVRTDGTASNGHVEHAVVSEVTGPTVYGIDEPDLEVRHLRERGFTVIPPMQVIDR